jgi:hypothetical protein
MLVASRARLGPALDALHTSTGIIAILEEGVVNI